MLQAGDWETAELEYDEGPYRLMPGIAGRLVKPKNTSARGPTGFLSKQNSNFGRSSDDMV